MEDEKNLAEKIMLPPYKVRAAEIGAGLVLAHYGDLPVAIVGGVLFLHGFAGDMVFDLFRDASEESLIRNE